MRKQVVVCLFIWVALVSTSFADVFVGPSFMIPTAGQYSGNAESNLGYRFGFDFEINNSTQQGLTIDLNEAKFYDGNVSYLNFTFFDRYYLPELSKNLWLFGLAGAGYTKVKASWTDYEIGSYAGTLDVEDWFINLDLGIGFKYYATDRFSMELVPSFRYQVNDLVNDSAILITFTFCYLLIK